MREQNRSTVNNMGVIFIALVAWSLLIMYCLRNIGLADNGDFTRSMTVVATEPLDISPNWPVDDSEKRQLRFDNYWIPLWKIDDTSAPTDPSSSELMFIMGSVINRLFYSPRVLNMNYVALAYWWIVPFFLGLLWLWVSGAGHGALVYAAIAIPVTLILSSGDYVVYWKSFYQEGGTLVYVVICLIALVWFAQSKSIIALVLCVAFGFLVATSKPLSYFWFTALLAGVLALTPGVLDQHRPALAAIGVVLSVIAFCISPTHRPEENYNQFNSLFNGVLVFSDCPECRLRELGLPECTDIIQETAFSPAGKAFLQTNGSKISFLSVVRVVLAEPKIVVRALTYSLDAMQVIGVNNLGHNPVGSPIGRSENIARFGASERGFNWDNLPWAALLWSAPKYYLFPRGWLLVAVLLAVIAVSVFGLRSGSPWPVICLLCSMACLVSVAVAIFGDGRMELIKHLFMANLMFDCVVVSAIAWVAVRLLSRS